jgi:hypothetical protein
MINVEMKIREMECDDTRWGEVKQVRVQWRTVELWGLVTIIADNEFCSTQAATETFFVKDTRKFITGTTCGRWCFFPEPF